MPVTIIGVDYSMNSPALCINDSGKFMLYGFIEQYTGKRKHEEKQFVVEIDKNVVNYRNEMDRYSKLAEKLLAFILDYKNPMVYLEGYSMGSKGLIFNIAENTAVFKYLCFCNDVPVITVPPTTIKKYVTGKGNATKDVMYDVFVKDTSVDLQNALFNKSRKLGNPVTDLVDAYYIAKWGQEQFDGTGQEAKKEATTET